MAAAESINGWLAQHLHCQRRSSVHAMSVKNGGKAEFARARPEHGGDRAAPIGFFHATAGPGTVFDALSASEQAGNG